jgi:hypothetical protein
MRRRLLLLGPVTGLLISASADAQSGRPSAALDALKQAIIAATGYDAAAVEVKVTPVQLMITLVNSRLIDAPSRVRENEATNIVAAIVKTSGDAELRRIQAIHVDYVARDADGGNSRTVDAIDFRKTPRGDFQHHIT